ncbi:hypothetical protein [Yersinia enterocolitica]|uniref:hypothetical protein n=1 Tax=Yersinia enterocolitica TaxID=630 RepID=UPI001C60E85A|nr:hypothetical protein [Yersinia enterocolitica]MBW5857501.1 hypothetical protein [Yersinia enterocolitica]MBW5861141.1 hypothetical protein [Yersinia enterocolitica]
MLSEEQKLQIKMSMNDKWHLVKLTHVWPDGHLINQMAHALIERNAELLSLREQLAELKALEPSAWILNHGDGSSHIEKDKRVADMFEIFAGNKTIPLFTAAKPAED